MTDTKFTVGPWRVEYKRGDLRIIANGECIMCDMAYYPWAPENEADWHLISAAPELYAALEWVVQNWDEHNKYGYPMEGDWVSDARKALAKARGENK